MKKTMKMLCIVLAVALLAMCMTACGGGSEEASGPDTTVNLGGIGPLTGDYAIYGTAVKNGAQIAVDEINEAGGVNGMKFELAFEDSEGDPESAVNAYGKLMDDGMDVSLGAVLSGENTSVSAAAAADGILLLSASASADESVHNNDCAFRICFYDSAQGTASANYIVENNLPTDVAVLYQSDIDYSVGLYAAFEKQAAEVGITIKEVQTFTDDTKTDFSTQIAAIKDAGVELVFLPIYYNEAATFLTQAYGMLPEGTAYFGCDGLDGLIDAIADKAHAENTLLLTPFVAEAEDDATKAFVAAYKEAYGVTPNQFAADGYDAVYAIKAALEAAEIDDCNVEDFDKIMVETMLEIEVTGLTGTMTWDENGDVQKEAKAMIIHDGATSLFGE